MSTANKRNITPKVPGQPAAPAADAALPVPGADAPVEQPAVAPKAKADELPDQDDIDRSKISRPVLSKQGWVLPIDKPTPQFAKG